MTQFKLRQLSVAKYKRKRYKRFNMNSTSRLEKIRGNSLENINIYFAALFDAGGLAFAV